MVGGAHGALVVRRPLVVALQVVVTVIDARQRSDPQTAEPQHTGVADEVDVGGEPAAVGQSLHVV